MSHFAGTCTAFEMNGSGEDVQIDRARGLAYVSLFDRQALADGDPVAPGDILRLDLTRTPLEAVSALADGPQLRPHGISLFIDQNGQRHLFVINHPEDRATGQEKIERYREETPGVFRASGNIYESADYPRQRYGSRWRAAVLCGAGC